MSSCAITERLNVVILYEQRAFVGRAMSTYFHIKRELGNELETDLRLWRIDIAVLPESAAQADHDIEAADVIIMAVRGGQPCQPAFLRWKTGTGAGLGVPHCAVITITETADEPVASTETWASVLRGFATQIHPEIYVWDPYVWDPPEDVSATTLEPPTGEPAALQAEAVTAT